MAKTIYNKIKFAELKLLNFTAYNELILAQEDTVFFRSLKKIGHKLIIQICNTSVEETFKKI